MSKKNKGNKYGKTAGLYEVKMAGTDHLHISYSPEHDLFFCGQCGGTARWEGGRFGPAGTEHQMEVIRCAFCGHATDPALIIDEAIKARDDYAARMVALAVAADAKAKLEAKVRFDRNYRRAVVVTAIEAVMLATGMISLMGAF